jgi:hypothetical protein
VDKEMAGGAAGDFVIRQFVNIFYVSSDNTKDVDQTQHSGSTETNQPASLPGDGRSVFLHHFCSEV